MPKPKPETDAYAIVSRWLRDAGCTWIELADAIGTTKQTVSSWKDRGVSEHWFAKIADFFHRSVDELYGRAVAAPASPAPGLLRIPVLGIARPTELGYWARTEPPSKEEVGFIDMPSSDRGAYCIRILGDAFFPRIRAGEYIIVEPNHEPVVNKTVLVTMRDGNLFVRTFLSAQGGLIALQDINGAGRPLTLREDEVAKLEYVAGIIDDDRFRAARDDALPEAPKKPGNSAPARGHNGSPRRVASKPGRQRHARRS